jgi:hypothetical protein
MSNPNQPTDVREVLCELADTWAGGEPPTTVTLANVNGEWVEDTSAFLIDMIEQRWYADDQLPGHTRDDIERITGQQVGTYGQAARALLDMLDETRSTTHKMAEAFDKPTTLDDFRVRMGIGRVILMTASLDDDGLLYLARS